MAAENEQDVSARVQNATSLAAKEEEEASRGAETVQHQGSERNTMANENQAFLPRNREIFP